MDERLEAPIYGLALTPLPDARLLGGVHALAAVPRVSEGMEWLPHASIGDTEEFFAFCARDRQSGLGLHFALESCGGPCGLPAGTLLGVASVFGIDRHLGRAEITTWLGEPFWGRGLNKQAKHMAFHLAFESLGLHKVVMRVAVENEASIRSHAKLHTTLEGVLRDELLIRGRRVDCRYYGLLADDYRRSYPSLVLARG